jgi:putative acetyltransferase
MTYSEGLEIRPEQSPDRDAVLRVVAAAFGEGGERVADIWAGIGHHRRGSLVGELGGRIVGHVGLSQGWVDARRELVEAWVLSPLSVDPDHQRAGIGTALLAAAVATARGSGVPVLFLEGSPVYYGPRGFERADGRGFLPAALERTPRPAFQCVVFDAWEEWMTGQMIYPAVWWEHDAAGLRDPGLTEIEQQLAHLD